MSRNKNDNFKTFFSCLTDAGEYANKKRGNEDNGDTTRFKTLSIPTGYQIVGISPGIAEALNGFLSEIMKKPQDLFRLGMDIYVVYTITKLFIDELNSCETVVTKDALTAYVKGSLLKRTNSDLFSLGGDLDVIAGLELEIPLIKKEIADYIEIKNSKSMDELFEIDKRFTDDILSQPPTYRKRKAELQCIIAAISKPNNSTTAVSQVIVLSPPPTASAKQDDQLSTISVTSSATAQAHSPDGSGTARDEALLKFAGCNDATVVPGSASAFFQRGSAPAPEQPKNYPKDVDDAHDSDNDDPPLKPPLKR